MRLHKACLGQCLQRALGRSHIALNAFGQFFHRQALELAQRTQGNQRINGQLGIAAALLVHHQAAKLQVGRHGGQAQHDVLRIGAGVVGCRAAKLEQPPVNGVHATARALHHANALHGIGQRPVAGSRLGHQQVGQRNPIHQAAGVTNHQGIVLQPHMHRAQAVVVAVDQSIGHGLTESAHVHQWHRHTEQTHLQLLLGVVRAEIGLQPIHRLEQRVAAELVELHRLLRQHLERKLVRGHPLLQRCLAPHQQQPGQRGLAAAIGLACREPQGAVQRLIVQLQQHPVAAILLHRLAQALALQRVKVGQRGTCHRLGRHIHQAKARCAAGALVRQHGRTFGCAIVLDAPSQIHPALRGHLALRLGYLDASHSHTAHLHGQHADVDRRRGARRHHACQTRQHAVVWVQAGGRAIVLHAQPKLAAFGIGQAHHGLHQFRVGQAFAVAFEFDGEGFDLRDG